MSSEPTTTAQLRRALLDMTARWRASEEQAAAMHERLVRAQTELRLARANLDVYETAARSKQQARRDADLRSLCNSMTHADELGAIAAEQRARIEQLSEQLDASLRGSAQLVEEASLMRRDLIAYRVLNGTGGAQNPDVVIALRKENVELREALASQDKQLAVLRDEIATLSARHHPHGPAGAQTDPALGEATRELGELDEAFSRVQHENTLLRAQLAAFSPELMREVAAFRTVHERALDMLHQYRHWLLLVAKRHGVSFPKTLLAPLPAEFVVRR